MKPNLYCPKCKEFVEFMKEKYIGPVTESRKWDGEFYELIDSNIGELEYEQLCAECGTLLECNND